MNPPPHAPAWRPAALIGLAAFVAAALVHTWVLQGFANSGDEYAYLWQATAFAEGRVTAESPQPVDAFPQNHLGDVDGRRFSKYPPGWPLLLSAGVRAGWPGLVNPLLGALAMAGIYMLGCAWVGRSAANWGVLVVGASPFFLLNAGSYHSHPACLFALTALALCLTGARERPSGWFPLLAGASFGLAVLVRPYTALLIGVPLLVGLGGPVLARAAAGRRHGWMMPLAWFGLGGAPAFIVLLAVNQAVTGVWWMLPWTRYDSSEVIGFGGDGHSMLRGVTTALRLIAEGVLYTSCVAVPALLAARGQRFAHRRLLWILLIAPVVGYVFWWSHGGNRYGPRFYFEALLPLTLLAGVGLDRLARIRSTRMVAAAVVTATIAAGGILGHRSHAQVHARRDVYRAVEAARLERALVLLTTASADMVRIDLNRNPPAFKDARVLYGLSRPGQDQDVAERYPDRALYYYRWQPDGGRLWPVSSDEVRRQSAVPDRSR